MRNKKNNTNLSASEREEIRNLIRTGDDNNEDKKKKKGKTIWIIILLIIIIILLLLRSCANGDITTPDFMKVEEGVEWDGNNPINGKNSKASSERFDVLSYSDIYLSEDNKFVNLINPEGNTVYFQYCITNEAGEVLTETDLIAPNSMVERDLYSVLSKGENELIFTIRTFDVKTQEPCTGVDLSVKIIVE